MPDPTPDATPPPSPNGELVGLSALLNKMPPWAMNVVLGIIGLAASIEAVAAMQPDLIPVSVVKAAHIVFAVAVVGGMASPGVRK